MEVTNRQGMGQGSMTGARRVAGYRIGAKMALAISNAGTACRWVRNAQVVITKAVSWHCHSEPITALSIDFGRVRATAPPANAAITTVIASTFSLGRKKLMAIAPLRLGAGQ
jgi:hypothetical protein